MLKQSDAMVATSRKVPLEIFFSSTILSDDNSFSECSDFFTRSLYYRGEMAISAEGQGHLVLPFFISKKRGSQPFFLEGNQGRF